MTMTFVGRRLVSCALALMVVALGGASVAWACSAQPHAGIGGGQTSGPVGTQVTVTGRDFDPGPVQVRWNSKSGQLLGEGQGPTFSVPITIPQAPAGVHYIVAVQPLGGATASLAFEVTAPARTTTNSTTNNSGTTSASASGAEEETTTNSSSTQTTAANNSKATTSETDPNPAGNSTNQSTANTSPARSSDEQPNSQVAASPAASPASSPGPAGAAPVAAVSPATSQTRSASANPAVVTTPAGQAVFGGSSATPVVPPAEADKASAATVSGDTWSGFASGAKPSLLSGEFITSNPGSGSGSGLGIGVGLIGAGLVALFAGFAVAESSRKRAFAGTQRR